MKTTLLALLMLVGFSAVAESDVQEQSCPELSGVYTCGEEELAVDTYELGGTYYLEFNTNGGLAADGTWLQLPDSEDEKNAKIRLTCGSKDPYGAHYLLDYESEIYDQGNKFADVDAEVYFHMEGDNFVQTTTGKAIGDFGEFPLDEKVVCTKK